MPASQTVPDLSKADERNAKLILRLRAKSGYSCDVTYHVSPNDWAAVCKLLDNRAAS